MFSGRQDRYRQSTGEGRIQWARGVLILASMVGVFLIYFVVLSLLQYGTKENPEIRGLAPVGASYTPAASTAQAAVATPESSSPTGITATVRQSPYVRSGPGIDYPVRGNLVDGSVVAVTGRTADGAWIKVQAPNGVLGWSGAAFLTLSSGVNNVPVTQ